MVSWKFIPRKIGKNASNASARFSMEHLLQGYNGIQHIQYNLRFAAWTCLISTNGLSKSNKHNTTTAQCTMVASLLQCKPNIQYKACC